MARKRDRAFALVAAILFFATSVGFSGLVVWQILDENKQDDEEQSIQNALQEGQQTDSQQGGLKGTKLADFTPVDKVDVLQIVDLTVGTGDEVTPDVTVIAHYTGALVKDGTIFESSHDGQNEPFTSPLGSLIKGWQDGMVGMKVGGKRRLLIPAAQAYGDQEQPGIPANSDLVFDIELVGVQK